jgi:hypothetical protein
MHPSLTHYVTQAGNTVGGHAALETRAESLPIRTGGDASTPTTSDAAHICVHICHRVEAVRVLSTRAANQGPARNWGRWSNGVGISSECTCEQQDAGQHGLRAQQQQTVRGEE